MYKIEETLPSPGIEAFIRNPVLREMARNEIKNFNKQSPSNALVSSATAVGLEMPAVEGATKVMPAVEGQQ